MKEKYISLIIVIPVFFAWHALCAVNCTATGAGRFADLDDTKCKNYTFCIFYPPGYVSHNFSCPSTSMFNPKTAKCTTDYTCNTTTDSTGATSPCNAAGFFIDPVSTDCSSYIECVDINGTYIKAKFDCPNNTYFNPSNGNCEVNYKCPSSFICTFAGRFPNISDTTCKSYYFCIQQGDGSFVQQKYTCPSISVFSPALRLCTTSYKCP